jgi:DNA polymerase elongation subunit (family B)
MTTVLPQSSGIDRTETVKVDIKKVDYTTRDWDDTDELKEEIRDYHPEAEEIIQTIDQHGAGLRPVIHILGRTSGGTRVHLRVHGVKPYFYMPHEKFKSCDVKDDKRVTGTEKGYYGINGKHMVKVCGRIPGDIGGRNSLRNDYAPDSHHEADILFPNRFLIDSGIEGAVEIPSFHATPEPTDIPQYDLEPTEHSVSTRMCFCDIEVDDKDGFPSPDRAEREVTCITVYDDYVEDYIVFLYHPELPDVHHDEAKVKIYDDESRMLRAFNKYIVNRDFDAITGWNFSDFDARYLVNRLDVLEDDEDAVDVDKNELSKFGSAYDDGYFGAKIKGMAVVDMLRAYQNLQFTDLDSYSLEDVAQEELGTGKIKDNRDLYVLWENEPQKLVDYNFKDVELTVKLEQKQNIIKFYEEIANYVGGRLAEVVDASKAVDVKVLRAVHGEWAVPSSGNVETEEFEGAKVFDPISGVKDDVIVLDLKSLYPMSMKTMNAGPETKDEDGELVAPNGIRFNNDEDAVVVEIIDEMLEERQKYKDLRNAEPAGSSKYKIYDRKQSAVKVVMNTLYGVMGWDRFRLQDREVGAAVTAVGREVIKFTEEVVEDMGYQSVYGDTDSVMIQIDEFDESIIADKNARQRVLDKHDVNTFDELRAKIEDQRGEMSDDEFDKLKFTLIIGFEMEELINERYDDFAKDELNADEHYFQIEFEKLYKKFFQSGKKKRYAGLINWKEGKFVDKVDNVGFETNRSDYSKAAKEIISDTIEMILRGADLDDLHDNLSSTLSALKNEEVDPDKFGIPAAVRMNFDEYDNETVAVKGSKYANENFDAGIQPGDKPKMHYVKRILPDENGVSQYPMPDRNRERKQVCCWMNYRDIPDVVEWDWEEYIEAQIQGPLERIFSGTDWSWSEVVTGNRQPKLGEFSVGNEPSDEDANVMQLDNDSHTDGESGDTKLDGEFNDDSETTEAEARNQLSNAQEMLDGLDGDDADNEIKMDAVELDDGPTSLNDFM